MEVKFDDIVNIYEKEIRKNCKNKRKIYRFERFKMQNLTEIYEELTSTTYHMRKYNIFGISSPKYRIVMSLSIKDKIINHYIARHILIPKLEHLLDDRNVATRIGMGRDYGIKLVKKFLEVFKKKERCFCLKMDIKKYFYSINHNKLKSLFKDYLNNEEYDIMCHIIDSTNCSYVNKEIIKLKKDLLSKDLNRSDEIEKLPLYMYGKGLPIGNMTSQFLAIFYLHRLYHKIIHDYHLKHIVIYMDDILIFHSDKDYLKRVKDLIEKELNDVYMLELNKKKTQIIDVKNGFSFCGYNFRIIDNKTVIKVCKDTRRRIKKRLKEEVYLFKNDKISFKFIFSSVNTYMHGFKFGDKKRIKRIVYKNFFSKF